MTRGLSSLLLALVLALTSQSMAVARGATAASDRIVLCTGTGPMAIYVDAEGKPTHAPHICPDSTLHVLFEVEEGYLRIPQTLVWDEPAIPTRLGARPTMPRPCPPCRAPPLAV